MTRARSDPQVARGIRRVRLERGWTLREVALLFGCNPSRICRIENGERGTPDPAEAAGKLGVPVSYLMAPCPQCGYRPPHGYLCLRCGTQATSEADSDTPCYAAYQPGSIERGLLDAFAQDAP
jgi:transcriptional regulator with XRE-family HTH domain